MSSIESFSEYTRRIIPTRLLANLLTRCPLWGYPTEDAYYRDASSTDAVLAIRIPFLAIHAVDDPVSIWVAWRRDGRFC